jgi:hypothetical protein
MESVAAEVGSQVADYFGNRRSTRGEMTAQFKHIIAEHNPELAAIFEGKGRGKKRGK